MLKKPIVLIRIAIKLIKISFYAMAFTLTKKTSKLFFFLTIDTECKFTNKIEVDKESYEKDLYESSLKIAELAEQHNIRAIYFVDCPEIQLFRNHDKSIEKLIRELDRRGHSIQIHIHPAINNPEKSPDLSCYPEEKIRNMISEGKEAISKITGKNPFAFRAGGYSVGDWQKIYSAMKKEGILLDSSAFSGAKNLHNAVFDFTDLENMKPYYPSPYSLMKKVENGSIVEFPITTAVKCSNKFESWFFRFDPNNNIWLLKIFTNYLCKTQKKAFINMITIPNSCLTKMVQKAVVSKTCAYS